MKSASLHHHRNIKGSALVITLVALVLITVIAVGYISSVMFETKAARSALNEQKAYGMAELAMHSAVGQLRDALGSGTTSWDNPFGNFIGTGSTANPVQPAFFWSVSPGLLTRWEYSSAKFTGMSGTAGPTYAGLPTADKYPLFSGTSFSISGTLGLTVNLNRQKADGTYPIISGSTVSGATSAPPVTVQWVNVLQNPSQTAGSTNQVIGRFAYWVDDENAKININTADGTNKGNTAKSMGAGSPAEVSLLVLSGTSGTGISATTGSNIVQIARTVGFHSPREILRAAGTTPDIYTNNVFNLTSCSRSPELSIFGQPRIPMVQAVEVIGSSPVALGLNCITMMPFKEIYPTSSQLGALTLSGSALNGVNVLVTKSYPNLVWPTAFSEQMSDVSNNASNLGVSNNKPGTNGMLLAYTMAGRNPAGTSNFYTWPAFPGSVATNYLGKYTPRQLDSIAWQITDLGGKATSSDFYNLTPNSGSIESANSAPSIFLGWLSYQYVQGMGRSPKVTKYMMELITKPGLSGSAVTATGTYNPPPEVNIQTWQEWWLPAQYQGVGLWNHTTAFANWGASGDVGETTNLWKGYLNAADQALSNGLFKLDSGTNLAPRVWSPNGPQAYSGYLTNFNGTTPVPYYWGNNLMTNNQGIDFTGNPAAYPDPDQTDAQTYHAYLLSASGSVVSGTLAVSWPSPNPCYLATSPNPAPVNTNPVVYPALFMNTLASVSGTLSSPSGNNVIAWQPGEIRVPGTARSAVYYMMSSSAGGGTLTIGGGLASISYFQARDNTEMDAVPLEAERCNTGANQDLLTNPLIAAEKLGFSGTNVHDRLIASVVPMNGSVPVPADNSVGTNTLYIYATVAADPLVNKFPGDWITTTSTTLPATTMLLTGSTKTSISMQTTGTNPCKPDPLTSWYDPDSYWVPTMDSAVFQGDSPAMPRAARFPSIGYLNYIRTGIIPDDETVSYITTNRGNNATYNNNIQHGTPYRLLNFAPSYDPAGATTTPNPTQKTTNAASNAYPDWAMLDLMYVPSMLLCYGSPYTSFASGTTTIVPVVDLWDDSALAVSYQNTAVVNNMFSYGTYGGATSGRINPNGTVIYTTDVNNPAKDSSGNLITRTVPLQAMLHGLSINQNLTPVGTPSPSGTNNYAWTGGTTVADTTLASAIATYIQANGPLRMPAEICNIPAVSALAPSSANGTSNGNSAPYSTAINNPTRNDLVRQIVGNLTTQSNTFSVWVAGQSVQKVPRNKNYGQFESGDNVLGDVRYHFIVERYLDPGADGVYGNLASAGLDGIVGTLDDPVDPVNNPFNPRYLYRVISAEQIR